MMHFSSKRKTKGKKKNLQNRKKKLKVSFNEHKRRALGVVEELMKMNKRQKGKTEKLKCLE